MQSYNGFSAYERSKGQKILNAAIARGEIPDANELSCVICGQDKGIRHYHNEDYSPENIITDAHCVCWRCHMMIHKRFNHPNSFAKYMLDVTIYKKRFAPVFKGNDWLALNIHMID